MTAFLTLLTLGVIVWVLYPLVAPPRRERETVAEAPRELAARKQALYAALQELDYDRAMGKLSEADYQELRNRYRARAAAIVEQMERSPRARPRPGADAKELEDEIEREIRARRKH